MACVVTALRKRLWPSAGRRAAISMPRVLPAPGRLSITTLCASLSPSFWPISRARMSVAPAGGYATSIFKGRSG